VWIEPLQKLAGVAEGSVSVVVHGHVWAIRTSEEGRASLERRAPRNKKASPKGPVRAGRLARKGR
jgi:hypothetical protein